MLNLGPDVCHVELPRFGGQVSGPRGGECTGSDELLFVVDWA